MSIHTQNFNPEPHPGLGQKHFRKICENGFGDRYNSYAYSMAWFQDNLYVGTSRANLCLLKFAMPFVKMDVWPIDCPYRNYTPDFEKKSARGEIWKYSPESDDWQRVFQAPLVKDKDGTEYSRDLGYRGMVVYQGKSDTEPALYVATWSRSRGNGPDILRSEDGKSFRPTPKPKFKTQGKEITFNAIRSLVPFKGKLYTTTAGASKGLVNTSGMSLIYETNDLITGEWISVNDPGFDCAPEVFTVYDMAVLGDYLYAGTSGINGFQIWRTKGEGKPPYAWEQVVAKGAGRGALNQGAASIIAFKNAIYVGTGIQNGGCDHRNKVGPAAAELIRVHPDGSWDIIVGNHRDGKESVSGLTAGFSNFFCGYIWRMGIHQDWLYVGTMDWKIILRYTKLENRPQKLAQLLAAAGIEEYIDCQGGCDLWRSYDGDNWLPVTQTGFGNAYNYGFRNIVSTPYGLFIGSANPFGPRVATRNGKEWKWDYVDNPKGGLEIWQGDIPR